MTSEDGSIDLLRQRRSVRRFRPEAVPADLMRRIVEAGTLAPSAGNRQGWHFTVVRSAEVRARMADAVRRRWDDVANDGAEGGVAGELAAYSRNFDWFGAAPVVVAVSARVPEAFLLHALGADAADAAGMKASAAMAAQNMMLAAQALGLGSCCLTGPLAARKELAGMLGIGRRLAIVCLIAFGYPAETPAERQRKPLEEVMRVIE